MDDELPPPFPENFENDADTSGSHLHEEEHEQNYCHIPLPEIEHTDLPVPDIIFKPISPKIVSNGVISQSPPFKSTKPPENDDHDRKINNILPKEEEFYGEKEVEQSGAPLTNGHLSPPSIDTAIQPFEEPVEPTRSEKSIEFVANQLDEKILKDKIDLVGKQENFDLKQELEEEVSPPASSAVEVPQLVEDDFDDDEFGDFAETNVTNEIPSQEHAAAPVTTTTTQDEDDDDDWGDFDKAPRRDSRLTSTASVEENDDDFGAFGGSSMAESGANFETTESWTPQFVESPREAGADAENWEESLLQKVVDIDWKTEDCDESCFSEAEIIEISTILRPAPVSLDSIPEDCALRRSFELWCLLRIVEEAKSLKYVFDGSTLATNHYKKINIDKNHINRANLTAFSADTILTPIPVNGGVLQPSTPSEPAKSIVSDKEVTPPAPAATTPTGVFDSLSAPPAEFDWDKSGLTNPLKGSKSSALLDMDFLSSNAGTSTSGAFTLQKDLAAFGLDSPEPSQKSTEKSILDTILSSAATAQNSYKPVSELSLDARALHDQLPDISCLLQTKIMLPFGGQSF